MPTPFPSIRSKRIAICNQSTIYLNWFLQMGCWLENLVLLACREPLTPWLPWADGLSQKLKSFRFDLLKLDLQNRQILRYCYLFLLPPNSTTTTTTTMPRFFHQCPWEFIHLGLDSTVGKVLVSSIAGPGSIPRTHMIPKVPIEVTPEHRARCKPWLFLVWPLKTIKKKGIHSLTST